MFQLERLKYYYNRCDPSTPIDEEDSQHFYINFDRLELRGKNSCIDEMYGTIQLSDHPTTQIFSGFPGSGKTSELLRLAKILRKQNYLVVYADSLESIDTLNPIEYSDVLIALGIAVDKHFTKLQNDGKFVKWAQKFWHDLEDILFAEAVPKDLSLKIGSDYVGAEIGLELRDNPGFRSVVRRAANDKRHQFLEQVRQFFNFADKAARENGYSSGLVLILDNLEKLSSDDDTRTSAREMLLHNADALRQPGVHLIYTVPAPFLFSAWVPRLTRLYDGSPQVLPMVKIHHRDSLKDCEEGVQALGEMLKRRIDFKEVLNDDSDVLTLLVKNSGGYMRDLLRLLQYSLQTSWGLPIRKEHVLSSIEKFQRSYRRGFSTEDIDLLNFVKSHRPNNIPDDLQKRLEDMMFSHYIMIYANGDEWYDVHPIVKNLLDAND